MNVHIKLTDKRFVLATRGACCHNSNRFIPSHHNTFWKYWYNGIFDSGIFTARGACCHNTDHSFPSQYLFFHHSAEGSTGTGGVTACKKNTFYCHIHIVFNFTPCYHFHNIYWGKSNDLLHILRRGRGIILNGTELFYTKVKFASNHCLSVKVAKCFNKQTKESKDYVFSDLSAYILHLFSQLTTIFTQGSLGECYIVPRHHFFWNF